MKTKYNDIRSGKGTEGKEDEKKNEVSANFFSLSFSFFVGKRKVT